MAEIKDNTDHKRFEYAKDGHISFIEYILTQRGTIYLTHTEVPKPLEGGGVGSELVKEVLKIVEQRHLKLVPLCPFVAAYIRRHPEWKKLLAENVSL